VAKIIKAEGNWINSLLKRNLLQPKEERSVDLKPCWAQIERCRMVERMGEIVEDINGAAGNHILELQDYLPPQSTILRIVFSKWHTEYVLEIVARERGMAEVLFYSLGKLSELWEPYFRNQSRSVSPSISLELEIHPAEVVSDDLQRWFSYLLSGLKNKFKPNAARQPSETEYLASRAAVRKESA
jgi:hypothetical protein